MSDKCVIRVKAVQLSSEGQPVDEMLQRFEQYFPRNQNCDLIVLPELWLTGYFNFDRYGVDAMTLAEARRCLGILAKSSKSAVLCGSIVERSQYRRATNSSLLIDPDGGVRLRYQKTHLFPFGSREPELMRPGRTYPTTEVAGACVGVFICYDLRFPEVARRLVKNGADVLVVPAAWPAGRIDHWRLLLQARAVENQVFVVGCNAPAGRGTIRHGVELGGHSLIIGPSGTILAEANRTEGEITAELDLSEVAEVRSRFDTSGRSLALT